MKLNTYIKKAIDDNIIEKETILYNTLNRSSDKLIIKGKRNLYTKTAFKFATIFAVTTAIICCSIFYSPSSKKYTNMSKGTIHKTVTKKQEQSNIFTLVAYASENNSKDQIGKNNKSEIILKPNLKFELPFGKLVRGKPTFYIDDKRNKINGYEGDINGNVGFKCIGKNINSVTFTASQGELSYTNVQLMDKMRKDGTLYICRFAISENKVKMSDLDTFEKLWINGDFDYIKNKYFNGKNINLDNYSFHMTQTAEQQKKGEYFMEISEESKGLRDCQQRGSTIVTKGDCSWLLWSPSQKIFDKLTSDKKLDFSNLQDDVITVTAKFLDGQTLTQTIVISFNKDGSFSAEVK